MSRSWAVSTFWDAVSVDYFTFLKRLKMIPGLAKAFFAVLDGFRAAAADARHAVGAVAAPDRLAVLNRDVVRRAEPGTLTAAGAGIAGRKGISSASRKPKTPSAKSSCRPRWLRC